VQHGTDAKLLRSKKDDIKLKIKQINT